MPLAAKHGDTEAKFLANGVSPDFVVSPNGERVLLRRSGRIYVAECDWSSTRADLSLELGEAQALRTSDLLVRVKPADEWREVFVDAWRQARQRAIDPRPFATCHVDALKRANACQRVLTRANA